jgi:ribosomal protein S14
MGSTTTPAFSGRSSEFSAAMSRSAAKRRCPKCGRKSALLRVNDETMFGRYCRWDDCDYERVTIR